MVDRADLAGGAACSAAVLISAVARGAWVGGVVLEPREPFRAQGAVTQWVATIAVGADTACVIAVSYLVAGAGATPSSASGDAVLIGGAAVVAGLVGAQGGAGRARGALGAHAISAAAEAICAYTGAVVDVGNLVGWARATCGAAELAAVLCPPATRLAGFPCRQRVPSCAGGTGFAAAVWAATKTINANASCVVAVGDLVWGAHAAAAAPDLSTVLGGPAASDAGQPHAQPRAGPARGALGADTVSVPAKAVGADAAGVISVGHLIGWACAAACAAVGAAVLIEAAAWLAGL